LEGVVEERGLEKKNALTVSAKKSDTIHITPGGAAAAAILAPRGART